MKKIFTLLIVLQLSCLVAAAQTESRQALASRVEAYRQEVFKAGEIFLNRNVDVKARISAVAMYPFLYDEGQIAGARSLLLNQKENVALRAAALSKLANVLPEDDELSDQVINWMKTPGTPKELRDECLKTIQGLSFSTFSMYQKWQQLVAALRTLTRDRRMEYRQFAFNYLLAHGDSYAQDLLIKQIENNTTEFLPNAEAVAVLTLNPHGDYLPSVFKLMERTKDNDVKVECISALGGYRPAKAAIVGLLKDKRQDTLIRTTALGVINEYYPAEFAVYTRTMVEDEKELENLRAAAISMEMFRRQSNQERHRRSSGDIFDKSIVKLKNSPSLLLRKLSAEYLENVRPNL